jgi:putative copper export protein
VGPLVAGVLIGAVSWRAIFFLSLPLVIAAIAIGVWTNKDSRNEQITLRQIDVIGAALAALGACRSRWFRAPLSGGVTPMSCWRGRLA